MVIPLQADSEPATSTVNAPLPQKSTWDTATIHAKIAARVSDALAASVRDGLTHLDPAYWGSVKFEVVNTMLGDWGPKMEVRLRFKTEDPVADKHRLPETDYKQAHSGFALLLEKAAFNLMGEERFIETRANTLLRTISIMEAKFCKKHLLKPKSAMRASEERGLNEEAGEAPLPTTSTWDTATIHAKIASRVSDALAASVRDGLTHLDPAYWGSVKFEVVNTMLGDWGPKMEVRLRFKTDDPVADKYRIPETDYKQAPSGFALLLDKAAFKLMGEERFVETRANTLLRTISIMEAKFCKEHRLKPKPAIRASEERALIEQAVGQAREPKRLTRSL